MCAIENAKGAAFAWTCLFFDETGTSWERLNTEEELNLKYYSNAVTNMGVNKLSLQLARYVTDQKRDKQISKHQIGTMWNNTR